MLRVWKNWGMQFCEAAHDRGNCGWVLHAHFQRFERCADFLKRTHGRLMPIGKHRGFFYDEIIAREPGYADWVRKLVQPSGTLLEFIEYSEHGAEHMGKCHCVPAPQTPQCVMCCDRPINTAFVPCGRAIARVECGSSFGGAARAQFVSGMCALHYGPMCRELIAVSATAVLDQKKSCD